jgi:hypothetical protein
MWPRARSRRRGSERRIAGREDAGRHARTNHAAARSCSGSGIITALVGLIDWVGGRAAQCEVRRATLMRCWTPACRRRHQVVQFFPPVVCLLPSWVLARTLFSAYSVTLLFGHFNPSQPPPRSRSISCSPQAQIHWQNVVSTLRSERCLITQFQQIKLHSVSQRDHEMIRAREERSETNRSRERTDGSGRCCVVVTVIQQRTWATRASECRPHSLHPAIIPAPHCTRQKSLINNILITSQIMPAPPDSTGIAAKRLSNSVLGDCLQMNDGAELHVITFAFFPC